MEFTGLPELSSDFCCCFVVNDRNRNFRPEPEPEPKSFRFGNSYRNRNGHFTSHRLPVREKAKGIDNMNEL